MDQESADEWGERSSLSLKYVSKPPANDHEFIGQLEVTFYRCRRLHRVHTLGLFYKFAAANSGDAQACHLNNEAKQCPLCGATLRRIIGNAPTIYMIWRFKESVLLVNSIPQRKEKHG
jgi:hypothetical protein